MERKVKITSLGVLRGIAVLAVCLCHLGGAADYGNVFKAFFKAAHTYGVLGVQIFFVISGFIIPFSLFKAGYTLRDYFLFLYKRFLRLHPPYLAALLITLIIAGASYKLRHLSNPETIYTVFKSLFYLHVPIDNISFWTLEIEAEYYIFIGLFFIVLIKYPRFSMILLIPVLLLLNRTSLSSSIGLIRFIPYFLTGLVGFMIYIKENNKVFEIITITGIVVFTFIFFSIPEASVSLATILIILYFKKPANSKLEFPGEISYSLYLIHFIIGVKIINVLHRVCGPEYNAVVFVGAFIVTFIFGWLFWIFIEKPATGLSNKVRYGVITIQVPENDIIEIPSLQ